MLFLSEITEIVPVKFGHCFPVNFFFSDSLYCTEIFVCKVCIFCLCFTVVYVFVSNVCPKIILKRK